MGAAAEEVEKAKSLIQTLEKRLASLKDDHKTIERQITETKDAIRVLGVLIANDGTGMVRTHPGSLSNDDNVVAARRAEIAAARPRKTSGDTTAAAIRRIARDLIAAKDRPMTRTEILAAAMDAGIAVGGKKPEKTISKVLTRGSPPEFFSIGPGRGYWPSGQPLPSEGASENDGNPES